MVSLFPLAISNVTVRKRGATLLGPISLALENPEFVVVMGPNGAGKTTLLRLIHGLARPSTGELTWSIPDAAVRQRQAFVFQSPILLRRSVLQNIAYPLRLRGLSRRQAGERASGWAERVGLAGALERPATMLSGGEQQKLALARALVCEPELLLLDEPTASLDGRATRDIETILQECAAAGTKVIMATHNAGQAKRLAHSVIFLLNGEINEIAGPSFFTEPRSSAAQAFLRGDIVE